MEIGRLLLRLALWWRNPPSPGRAKLILAVLALCLLVVLLEHVFGLPDWMRVNGRRP